MGKLKKRKKSSRSRGNTSFRGARKKARGKGHKGGKGMSGSGKRADQKKTLIFRYKKPYFGSKAKSLEGPKDKRDRLNVGDINKNIENFVERGKAEKKGKDIVIEMEGYKILGGGDIDKKIKVKAKSFSETAKKKIEDAGGEAVVIGDEGQKKKSKK